MDGLVEDGASALDESMLTGESAPVDKVGGSDVYGGTLNEAAVSLSGRRASDVTRCCPI